MITYMRSILYKTYYNISHDILQHIYCTFIAYANK